MPVTLVKPYDPFLENLINSANDNNIYNDGPLGKNNNSNKGLTDSGRNVKGTATAPSQQNTVVTCQTVTSDTNNSQSTNSITAVDQTATESFNLAGTNSPFKGKAIIAVMIAMSEAYNTVLQTSSNISTYSTFVNDQVSQCNDLLTATNVLDSTYQSVLTYKNTNDTKNGQSYSIVQFSDMWNTLNQDPSLCNYVSAETYNGNQVLVFSSQWPDNSVTQQSASQSGFPSYNYVSENSFNTMCDNVGNSVDASTGTPDADSNLVGLGDNSSEIGALLENLQTYQSSENTEISNFASQVSTMTSYLQQLITKVNSDVSDYANHQID